ncbi:hypothetical protein KS4_02820 [Poriferisphaera corsica]|uniref:Uncharacterized protein n=1 Tax=Poriferisphaera corsica TaxID=2528020 RepID=A0A517YPV6_9BACT|nr:hypothetical protein KS4_02820 [Poriferisphaera corsica]
MWVWFVAVVCVCVCVGGGGVDVDVERGKEKKGGDLVVALPSIPTEAIGDGVRPRGLWF